MASSAGAVNPNLQGVIIILASLPLLYFWFVMLRDLFGRRDLLPAARTFWLVLLLFFNVFGAALYYLNEYRGRRR